MSAASSQLGELETLGRALGLVDAVGNFEDDWLTRPGHYLSSVLANAHQRDAMVAFVDEVLGGEAAAEDPDGLTWLPIASHDDPRVSFYVVLDDGPANFVGIGVGARLTTTAPASRTSVHVPIFRAAKAGKSVPNAILIGQPGAVIRLESEITVDAASPTPGQAHLGAIGLGLHVPTDGAAPTFALTLRQLQMPGAAAPRDLVVSVDDVDELDDTALDLVLGLVRAQADALGSGPLASLAGLLGLRTGSGVPSLPLPQLASQGVDALAAWFEGVVENPATRAQWLGQLASLLGGVVSGNEVRLTIGGASVALGVGVASGSGGHPVVTPTLGVWMDATPSARMRAEADLLRLDLATGSAVALPRLAVVASLGQRPDGGTRLLDGDPRVDALRVGLALDQARRPVFVLAADGVAIGSNTYATLDLSTPDALLDAVGTALGDIVADLLAQLGPAGTAVSTLLGLAAPAGHPAVPVLDLAAFLQDPLGAVRDHWRTVLRDHAAVVPDLLATIRDLVSDAAHAGGGIDGDGSEATPWRLPIVGPVEIHARRADGGDRLDIALAARYVADTLGQRCTRVETQIAAGLVALDLAGARAEFLPRVEARLTARARGSPRAFIDLGPFTLTADHVGLGAAWRPVTGLSFDVLAPNLAVEVEEIGAIPLQLPALAGGGLALDAAGWDALERFAALLASHAPTPWVRDLVKSLGWSLEGPLVAHPRLRLADVAADPAAAISAWLSSLALSDAGLVREGLRVLSRVLTGTASTRGRFAGTGGPDDPYRVPLLPVAGSPELAVWLLPNGPAGPLTDAPDAIRDWRPGMAGLDPAVLERALASEAALAPDVAALCSGRPDIAAGLDALVTRWTGTDGRIVPPAEDPPGITVHRLADATSGAIPGRVDLAAILASVPATVVRVAVVAPGAPLPWDEVPDGRLLDLRAPGLAPEAFAQPAAAGGEWFAALAGRLDAKLGQADSDGVAGQAARIVRVLQPFAALGGGLALVAHDAAGPAALRAANDLGAVTAVVTLGAALGPVAFTILDEQPAADALRLLRWLLPPLDPGEPDDPDLAAGRGLVGALATLLPLDDPGRELRPASTPFGAPRPGLAAHAVFGVVGEEAVRRGITAVVASGLARRAMARATAPRAPVDGARLGLRLPFDTGGTGLTASGHALVELCGLDAGPTLSTARSVTVHVEIRRSGGWLVGGPDPARGPGPRPEHELRWLEANVRVPLGHADPGLGEIVLHEPCAFGIERERWIVRAFDVGAGADVVTPALPEVRILLSLVAEQLGAPDMPAAFAAVADVLAGLGLLSDAGGTVPDAVDHLLHEAAAHVSAALAASASRARIASGVGQLLAAAPFVTVDLDSGRVTLDGSGTPGERGLVAWTAHVEATAAGAASAQVTLGTSGDTPGGGAVLRLDTGPARVSLDWHRAGVSAPETIALWPAPDAPAVGRALARLVPAECARIALEYLRSLDETARGVIDASLDAIGLLGAPGAGGRRAVLLPAGLLADPVGWLSHPAAFGGAGELAPAKVAAFLDALKPIVGVAGAPGEWALANGVTVVAGAHDGHLRLGARIDTGGLDPVPGAEGRIVVGGEFALTLPPGQAPRPSVDLSVGLAGAAPGRRAVHVQLGDAVTVFVRPDAGPDLSLYPDPPGLGSLAQVAVTQALPFLLDHLAAQVGADLPGRAGAIVRSAGDALGLRTGDPLRFDGARLEAWAADPAASLVAALPTLTATALEALADAVGPVLPGGASAAFSGGELQVTVGEVALSWRPAPFRLTVGATISGLPAIDLVELALEFDTTGPKAIETKVGPGSVDVGGVTLRPYVAVAVGGTPSGGRRVELGLARDAGGTQAVAARWFLDAAGHGLVAIDGPSESTDAGEVALALLGVVLDLVATFALATDAVQDLLGNPVGSTTVREVLRGVLLENVPSPSALDADLFDPSRLLGRLEKLAVNLASASPSVNIGGGLSVGAAKVGSNVQVTLGVNGRIPLTSGDVVVSLEADSRWIKDAPPAGLALGVLQVVGDTVSFAPSFSVNGLGFRIAKSSGPLLDVGVKLGSVAVHVFGAVASGGQLSGGVQLQLSDLAAGVAGAQGGNPVAQGVMADAGSGKEKLAPAFSPALAVQKHGSGPVLLSLSAGEGSGPWWLAIQKGFGPVYIEQVGFGVTVREDQLERLSLLLDGRVSLFGLTAAVDDLQLTFVVASDASVFDPSRWAVDLAGFAIGADLAGLTLAGGLRKFGDGESVEYVGMLVARFAVYGLSVYGGYGTGVVDGQRFASFFAFGAVNGPIGGPPAFFLTGIGGGLGINRGLVFPDDLARFGEFPFIKALDPGAQPSDDPMQEIVLLREYFPMRKGEFWFAAGISFNSFTLVDGIAVVAVAIGDGLEIALLGLARMALPRPQIALVSIELGLICRFSTKEGVLWIQAQLTDNSWLLHESVRLTGGFAFVCWFGGPNRGQFVLTMGGFHPDFHRDGYPKVPRLGFRWGIGDYIVIKGENYFALTSEAVMAGGKLEASAEFGPAWAHVEFGANGIVYFDPFRFEVEVYARIAAGVTIDVWIGEITISISLGARIMVAGPRFHGRATFEVGPIELTVEFGDRAQSEKVYIFWEDFVRKYLEEAAPGRARVLTAIPGKGALAPGTGPGGTTDTGTADGSAEKPFEVLSEFEITVTTIVPTETLTIAGVSTDHPPSKALGIAPMGKAAANSELELHLFDADRAEKLDRLAATPSATGAFPVGVWGRPQPDDDKKVPKGDIIEALEAVRFEAIASIEGTLPKEIRYHQVEIGPRKPLPFVHSRHFRPELLQAAGSLAGLLPAAPDDAAIFAVARPWMARAGAGRTTLAALERERTAPPRLGSLTEGLATAELPRAEVTTPSRPPRPPIDRRVMPPRAMAILSSPVLPERPLARTTVKNAGSAPRVAAPTLAGVTTGLPLAMAAKLVRLPAAAAQAQRTVVASGTVPFTRAARGAVASVAARGAFTDARARLDALTGALDPRGAAEDAVLEPGEVAVLGLPNAERDVDRKAARPRLVASGGRARFVALEHGGEVLADVPASRDGLAVARGTERVAVLALGDGAAEAPGLWGWHSGQQLAYVGWASALAPGAVVRAEGASVSRTRQRFRAGWIAAADLVAGTTIVVTRFAQPIATVVVALDDPAGAEAARGLSIAVEGAERPPGRDGRPLAPTVVAAGNRSFLIYALAPEKASDKTAAAVSVSVASQDGWHLAGVLGGSDPPAALAGRLARGGLDALLAPLATGRGKPVSLSWVSEDGAPAPPVRPPIPQPPTGPRIPGRPAPTGPVAPGTPERPAAPALPGRPVSPPSPITRPAPGTTPQTSPGRKPGDTKSRSRSGRKPAGTKTPPGGKRRR